MTDIYQLLSDYYDLMEDSTKNMFRGLWDGYLVTIQNMYMELWLKSTANFVQSMQPYRVWVWYPITAYSDTDDYTAITDLISIPKLEDKYYSPTQEYIEGIDYTIESGAVHFVDPANNGKIFWAPVLYFKNVYFDSWGYDGYRCYGDDISEIVKAVEYGIKYGSNKKEMSWTLNALAGYPFAFVAGEVISVTDDGDYYSVVIGDNQREHKVYKNLIGTNNVVVVGDVVERFQPLIDNKVDIVEDYGYEYNAGVNVALYKTSTTLNVIDGGIVNAGDYISIADVWAGKTEYGVVDSFDAGTQMVLLVNPMYLSHANDAQIMIRVINKVTGPTTISISILSHVGLTNDMKDNITAYYNAVRNPALDWQDITYI